jgi:two-component system response regulator AtoC
MATLLVVDDEEGVRTFLSEALTRDGHTVIEASDGLQAAALLERRMVELVLTDLKMPGLDGLQLLQKIKAESPEVEVILLTAHGTIESAVSAIKAGAFDYLTKPLGSPAELRLLVGRALERRALLAFKESSSQSQPQIELSFGSQAMEPVVAALKKVAATPATVLLTGESGTGKEIAARALHAWSNRCGGPFVAVSCAALTDTLLESELFGHEKGAFTGAVAQRRGRIELAQGGTFFLDEVGELKGELQAKLLRVIQEKRFERVGGTKTLEAEVRWIAATHRDLPAMISRGEFREDLYHRLAVFPVRLPALRERLDDLGPLAQRLLQGIGDELGRRGLTLSPAAIESLKSRRWTGNVRELRNALERAAILLEGNVLEPAHLPPAMEGAPAQSGALPDVPLDELERVAIMQALQRENGNKKRAAERLQIGLRTLYDKLRRYGMPQS